MGIYEKTTYQVVCDEAGCYEESDETEHEHLAKKYALEAGWVQSPTGSWSCDKHAPPEKSRRKPKAKK